MSGLRRMLTKPGYCQEPEAIVAATERLVRDVQRRRTSGTLLPLPLLFATLSSRRRPPWSHGLPGLRSHRDNSSTVLDCQAQCRKVVLFAARSYVRMEGPCPQTSWWRLLRILCARTNAPSNSGYRISFGIRSGNPITWLNSQGRHWILDG